MLPIRTLCAIIFVALAAYSAPVLMAQPNLFPAFFGAIAAGGWQGQFNLDFFCMLLLSGLWVSWRHQFSPPGLALGLLAALGGAFFLSVYLLVITHRLQGGMPELLLGKSRI